MEAPRLLAVKVPTAIERLVYDAAEKGGALTLTPPEVQLLARALGLDVCPLRITEPGQVVDKP